MPNSEYHKSVVYIFAVNWGNITLLYIKIQFDMPFFQYVAEKHLGWIHNYDFWISSEFLVTWFPMN